MKTWTSGSGRIELDMTIEQAQSVSHTGQCVDDVALLAECPEIKKQLDIIDNKLMADVLSEYGCWEAEQLTNNHNNRLRLVWIVGTEIAEGRL